MRWNKPLWPLIFTLCLAAAVFMGLLPAANAVTANLVWSDAGRKALDESSLPAAVAIFDRAAQASPANESLAYGLAMLHLRAGNGAAARQTLEARRRLLPHTARLARAMLLAESSLGNTTDIVPYTLAAGLKAEILPDLANAKMAESQWRQAIALFEAAEDELGGLTPKNRFLLSKAYWNSNEPDHAVANFRLALADPQTDDALRAETSAALGALLFWNQPAEAAAYIADAVALNPQSANALMLSGDFAFLQRSDRAAMERAFAAAIAVDPAFAAAWLESSLVQSERNPDPRWEWLRAAYSAQGKACAALTADLAADEAAPVAERVQQLQSQCAAETTRTESQ